MQCQVRSMTEASAAAAIPEETVPEGHVGQVCREWLVREDGVLAYKLQHEEINQHYDGNRYRNQVARTDRVEAKTLQEIEEEEAEMVRQAYERMLLEQEERDAEVARRLQEQLLLEENKKQQSTEEEDQRLARELQERERMLMERKKRERELEREKRQVEQVHAMQVAKPPSEAAAAATATAASSNDSGDIDLTDFLLEPPVGLSGDELKKFREHQDAELARLLQEQETKRRGCHEKDRQMAIEAQDMELARVLQEQEKARLEKAKQKRAREKSRLKALQQQQQLDMERIEDPESGVKHRYKETDSSNRSTDGSESELGETSRAGVANVAMMLDPTYSRRSNSKGSLERPASHHSLGSLGLPSQGSSSIEDSNTPSPIKSPSTQSTGSSPLLETLRQDYLDQLADDNDPVPPYMPIQGQRRVASLEKTKKKKSRDSCKAQ